MEFERVMPHSIEAERAVLGACLIDRDAVMNIMQYIRPDDFYFEHNRILFSIMIELFDQGSPVDIITVSNKIGGGELDAEYGMNYLKDVALSVTTTANIVHHSKIIAEKSILRRLIKASDETANLSYEAAEDADRILERAESALIDIMQNKDSSGMVKIRDIIDDSLKMLNELYINKGKLAGVPTGFSDLDKSLFGLNNSDLILIAARPAMGKTSFALNIAANAAIRHHIPTAFFSLEMSKEQLTNRIICSEALIESEKLRSGDIYDDDWAKIGEVHSNIVQAPLFIDDTSSITVSEMKAKCKRLKQKDELGLVIIDYLQLMQGKGRNDNRQQEISEISRSLKIMAKELNVPVVTLSQLSRAPEARSDKRPMLSDLRESGAIEQDADIVMFLYRDDYYNPDTEKQNIAECLISKNRNGATRTIELFWMGKYTKFEGLDRAHTML